MPKQTAFYRPKSYRNVGKSIAPADTTATVTVAAAGADDSIIKAIVITSTDSAARNVSLIVYDGSTEFVIATLNVPITAGTDGATVPVDGLSSAALPLDSTSKKVLPLAAGCTLKAKMLATITAAKVVTINAIIEDF